MIPLFPKYIKVKENQDYIRDLQTDNGNKRRSRSPHSISLNHTCIEVVLYSVRREWPTDRYGNHSITPFLKEEEVRAATGRERYVINKIAWTPTERKDK